MGDNVVALVKELGAAVSAGKQAEDAEGKVIYFDILGRFMVSIHTPSVLLTKPSCHEHPHCLVPMYHAKQRICR